MITNFSKYKKKSVLFAALAGQYPASTSAVENRGICRYRLNRLMWKGFELVSISDKLLSIFGLFTFEQPRWTVEQAAEELGLAQSTTYRYFRKLSDAGLIVAISTGQYVLGPTITMLDRQMRMLDPLITSADELMQSLASTIEIPSVLLLCRLYRSQVMCIYTRDIARPEFAFSYERGRPMPLHRGAASKAIMAHLPARIVRPLIEENQKDITAAGLGSNWSITKKRLRLIRNAGFVVTRGDLDRGLIGAASPIFGTDGAVIGSFGIVMKDDKSTEKQLDEIIQKIINASQAVTT